MSSLSEQIFATDDIESQLLDVPQWNVQVLVKAMTARDRARMIGKAQLEGNGLFALEEVLPDLVIHCTFDPASGERVFQAGDRDALMAKSAAAIELIATVALSLSGMGEQAVDEAGKDFSPTQSDDSFSA
jgi:hypothetical protein